MQTLSITLKPIEADWVELRYRLPNVSTYESQRLKLSQIQNLIDQGELHYYVVRPNLSQVGKQLFSWIDGNGRWLSRAIAQCPPQGLVVSIAAEARLAHLPWEVLHDGNGFLVERSSPPIVPVRWVDAPIGELCSQERSLNLMFMATSPEGVEPALDFEKEEAAILRITEDLPLSLRVEESGCVEELGKRWRRYPEGTFDVFHLTGHASIRDGTPYFITETLTGDRQETTAAELAQAFELRFPRLVFLSGCRTAQASNEGTLSSMAESLVRAGVPAVLGWGRPVGDRDATIAAEHLYNRLAEGYSIATALGSTYRYLLAQQIEGWHLLRLCVRSNAWSPLVEPPEDYVPVVEPPQSEFLDAEDKVRVATTEQFVGRRRELQRCLRELRKKVGVLLHGLGGVGKSTVAARLLERLSDYTRIVIYRELDWEKLQKLLAKQCESSAGHDILNGTLPLMQRLTRFLKEGLNSPEQKFCFVLDDFEANLEANPDGRQVLKESVVEVLEALLQAVDRSKVAHRVILTSRYDVSLPESNNKIYRQPLAALRGADLKKKYERLEAFSPQSNVDAVVQRRAKAIADGNPRLLEWLDKVLSAEGLDTNAILQQMEAKEAEFREQILAEELLRQQAKELKQLLANALVYELPVPKSAIAAVGAEIADWEQHQRRAATLGLLETSQIENTDHYRVPCILTKLLPSDFTTEIYQTAAKELYRLWWQEAEASTEEQRKEIHRLAIAVREVGIASEMGSVLSQRWNEQSRYRETVELCKTTLEIAPDHRLLYNLAQAELTLGELQSAIEHYQQTLEQVESIGNVQGKAATLHELANIYAHQGQTQQALDLYQQSLALKESIGNVKGKAVTLHELAYIYEKQGQIQQALDLYQQSLALKESISDVKGKAVTLHAIANIHVQQGQIQQALDLYQQSLEIEESIGDVKGKATILHDLANICSQQGQIHQAIEFYQQSLEIEESIGDVKGKAETLHSIASIYAHMGQLPKALDFYQQSLELKESIDDVYGIAITLHEIAHIYEQKGQIQKAIGLYEPPIQI